VAGGPSERRVRHARRPAEADIRVEAREAIREVLAALREPSGAMQSAAMHRIGWLAIRDAMDVFARENGLEMTQEAQEGWYGSCGPDERCVLNALGQTPLEWAENRPSGDSAQSAKSTQNNSPNAPLPPYRTPGGHAA
jgi:hypothetical protein